jgi:hypothetical protein
MSIWADRQIHALNARVSILEERIKTLQNASQNPSPFAVPPEGIPVGNAVVEKLDHRTREYKAWKIANS